MDAYILHVGDTWRVTPKLTLNLAVRWDLHRPRWTTTNPVPGVFQPSCLFLANLTF